eukprot:gnl/MRDRNA2_/MRDRNA2_135730_c0_seq1.p2 gnl/MRDRNA2_/MRDRNA2_135730_c0~~gnl/MRDRNA2_/MRDRNA2_135730_c0_seq1.p2  ORF type:complete len:138 (+),score=16.08 gnl/MRDRNA2_/MRDRNA2_135730_c0_seq1:106-519(+)
MSGLLFSFTCSALAWIQVASTNKALRVSRGKSLSSDTCGPNTLEVSDSLYAEVSQNTHAEYLCECLHTEISANNWLSNGTAVVRIPGMGQTHEMGNATGEAHLCAAIGFVGDVTADAGSCGHPFAAHMDDLCATPSV